MNKLILTVLFSLFILAVKTEAKQKPNVLWIVTDDQRYDAIPAFNQMLHGRKESALGYVESPNVDRLTEMGTTYINTFCQAQGCAPSRASMHSGRYPWRSGIYQFEYFNNNTDNSYPLLPEEMKKLGYQTMHVGKLGVRIRTLNNNNNAVNYPIYEEDIDAKTFDAEMLPEWGKQRILKELNGVKLKKPIRNIVYFRDADGTIYYKSKQLEKENPQFKGMAKEIQERYDIMYKHSDKNNDPETPFHKGVLYGVSPLPEGKTRDGNYTSAFVNYLEKENGSFKVGTKEFAGVNPEKPLFCHIGYDFPHTPVLPPKSYRDRFAKKQYTMPELTDEEFKKMAKAFQKRVTKSYSDDFTDEQKQKMVQDYYAFCAYGDALIGEAVDSFMDYSKKHNQPWMIVYVCGDHGWKLNEHGAITKNTPWEMDSHNPIVVVSSDKKAFPAGKVVRDFTEFIDIAPTIMEAGGADLQNKRFAHLDGLSLGQVVSGKAPKRDYVIGESHHSIGPRAYIRTKEYMFSVKTRPNSKRGENMNWAVNASYEELDPALYNTKIDPDEKNNLAHDPKYREVADKMQEKLLNIVIGDDRAEINWGGDNYGKNVKAIGTKVYKSNFAPDAHDYKLKL